MSICEQIYNFSFATLEWCLDIEEIHREIYDKLYRQDYKITENDRNLIKLYNFYAYQQYPYFRAYLVYWKPKILEQEPKNPKDYELIVKLLKLNVNRYQPSIYLIFLD